MYYKNDLILTCMFINCYINLNNKGGGIIQINTFI